MDQLVEMVQSSRLRTLPNSDDTEGIHVADTRRTRCSAEERFPLLNNIWMLLKTIRGRCEEAANLFTCLCRALGIDSRHIYDPSDHVWTGVDADNVQRCIHCDAYENTCDSSLMSEQRWKKQLSFCVTFARDHLEDVT